MGGRAFGPEHESGNRLLLKYFLQELQELFELIHLVFFRNYKNFVWKC